MGRLTTDRPTNVKAYLRQQFEGEDEHRRHRVLDIAIKNLSVAYLAIEVTDTDAETRRVFAAVVLLTFYRDGTISYRALDEESGPCDADCPKRILDQLTPTDNENAARWRQHCRETIEARRMAPSLRGGNLLFHERGLKVGDRRAHWFYVVPRKRTQRHLPPIYVLDQGSYARGFPRSALPDCETVPSPVLGDPADYVGRRLTLWIMSEGDSPQWFVRDAEAEGPQQLVGMGPPASMRPWWKAYEAASAGATPSEPEAAYATAPGYGE